MRDLFREYATTLQSYSMKIGDVNLEFSQHDKQENTVTNFNLSPPVTAFLSQSSTIIFHEALLSIYGNPTQNFFDGIHTFFKDHPSTKSEISNDATTRWIYKIFLNASLAIIWNYFEKNKISFPDESSLSESMAETISSNFSINQIISDYKNNYFTKYKKRIEKKLHENSKLFKSDQTTNFKYTALSFSMSLNKSLAEENNWQIKYSNSPFNILFHDLYTANTTLYGIGQLNFSNPNPIIMYSKSRPFGYSLIWQTLLLIDLDLYLTQQLSSTSDMNKSIEHKNEYIESITTTDMSKTLDRMAIARSTGNNRLFNPNFQPNNEQVKDIFHLFDSEFSNELTFEDGDLKLTIPSNVLNDVTDEKGEFLCFDLHVCFLDSTGKYIRIESEIVEEDFDPDENQVVIKIELENNITFNPQEVAVEAAFNRSDEHDGYVVVVCFFGA